MSAIAPRELSERILTRDEYERLVDLDFFQGERVELFEGKVLQMSPRRVSHSVTVELIDRYMRRAFPSGHRVRVQLPMRVGAASELEPDLAVIAGDDPRKETVHPSTAALVVEISDTTLAHDRAKANLYAVASVPEYWIVNVVARSIEIYRQPTLDVEGYSYAEMRMFRERDSIVPLAAPGVATSVADLLP